MASIDYTKELGMKTQQSRVPLPVAIIVIVAVIAAAWYGFSTYKAPHHAADAGGRAAEVAFK